MTDFGTVIKEGRKRKGLSLRELARRIEISHPYLSQLENNRNNNPSPIIIVKLAKSLDIPVGILIHLSKIDIGIELIPPETIDLNLTDKNLYESLDCWENFLDYYRVYKYGNNQNQLDSTIQEEAHNLFSYFNQLNSFTKEFNYIGEMHKDTGSPKTDLSDVTIPLEDMLSSQYGVTINGRLLSNSEKIKALSLLRLVFEENSVEDNPKSSGKYW